MNVTIRAIYDSAEAAVPIAEALRQQFEKGVHVTVIEHICSGSSDRTGGWNWSDDWCAVGLPRRPSNRPIRVDWALQARLIAQCRLDLDDLVREYDGVV